MIITPPPLKKPSVFHGNVFDSFITVDVFFLAGASNATIAGVVVAVLILVLLIVGGVWFFYAYTHPTSASGQWMINVSSFFVFFDLQLINILLQGN